MTVKSWIMKILFLITILLINVYAEKISKVLYRDKNILSIQEFDSTEGGAHPIQGYTGINMKKIEIDDILIKEKLTSILRDKLEAEKNKNLKIVLYEQPGMEYTNRFNITKKGILFYYGYCHFCCAIGDITLFISYDELKEAIKSESIISKFIKE